MVTHNPKKIRILFVCLGNICRSTMAEGLFKHRIAQENLEDSVESDSAGTGSWHIGEQPDPRTLQTLKRHNISFSHKAQQVSKSDFEKFDFIVAMDTNNFKDLQKLMPPEYPGLLMLRDFDTKPDKNVPDPYFGGDEGFEEVYEIIDRSFDRFIPFIKEKLSDS